MAYGAAVAAGAIALISALEAWDRLQHPGATNGLLPALTVEALLALALPLLVVAALIGVSWLVRRVRKDPSQPLGSRSPGTE